MEKTQPGRRGGPAGRAGGLRRHLAANLVGYIALFFALGLGSAWAAGELGKNEVRSKHIKNQAVKRADLRAGSVDSSKVRDGSLSGSDFAAGELPQGPPGPSGPQGPAGEAGEDGEDAVDLWAVIRIRPDGPDPGSGFDPTVVRSKGTVTDLIRIGPGVYELDFAEQPDADDNCAYTAALSDTVSSGSIELAEIQGEILVTGDGGGMTVRTFDSAGNARDVGEPGDGTGEGGFHLTVSCP